MDTIIPAITAAGNTYTINDSWWDGFLDKTAGFTETTVIKDALSDNECGAMTAMVLKVIREVCLLKTNSYGFRVYLDSQKLNGSQLETEIFPNAPNSGEIMEEWVERVFAGKKFGMIINSGEKFSNELAQQLAIYAQPLLAKLGIPLNGLHSTIFIGNYGLTPLGIHQDHRGANVIHFHLGPGGKTMYTWDETYFKELLDGRDKNEVPVAELLPYAHEYPYGKGDIYFMPWNKFHIGESSDFSVGVTLWFDNHVRKMVLNNLFDSWKLQYMNMNDLTITTPETDLEALHGYDDLKALSKLSDSLKQKNFYHFLQGIYEECMYSLFSNAGWAMRPLSLEEETGYNENEYESLNGKTVQLTTPFRIYYRHITEENKLHIFARGAKIELNYHPAIIKVLDMLNEGNALPVNDIAEQVLSEFPAEVTLYILSLLYNRRSISVVTN